MDPITTSLFTFKNSFRKRIQHESTQTVAIVTPLQHVGTLAKVLRAEEWAPGNRSPYIIIDTPWLADENDNIETARYGVQKHYEELVAGFTKDGVTLEPFTPSNGPAKEPLDLLAADLAAFTRNTREYCSPPVFCWLPTAIKNSADYVDAIRYLLSAVQECGIHPVFAIEKEKQLKPLIQGLDTALGIVTFSQPEEAMQEYAAKLFAPPAAGHAQGTPSGSAAPDAAPPPRKIAPPSDEQIRESMEKLGLPPVLLPSQAEALRTALFAAAFAAGRNDAAGAVAEQQRACTICEEAGVRLEHALMRLTLANYHLQFRQEEEAMREYSHAEQIAAAVPAYTQLAQIRMAMAFVCMRKKKGIDEAIDYYEQSAAAAAIGQVWLLYLESLRMLGTCHLKKKDPDAAISCWNAAISIGFKMDIHEAAGSTLQDTAGRFIVLLEKEQLYEQAASVEAVVQEIAAQFSTGGGRAS